MKLIICFSLLTSIMSKDLCINPEQSKPAFSDKYKLAKYSDDTSWIISLSNFRNALLSVDKETVKSYFQFPFLSKGNEIWMVVDSRKSSTMDPNKIVPFKEQDFDKYFSNLLGIDFRRTLAKIDLEKLSKNKTAESPAMIIVAPATSKLKAVFSESKKTLLLSLANKAPDFEYSIEYHFKIVANKLKFYSIRFIMK